MFGRLIVVRWLCLWFVAAIASQAQAECFGGSRLPMKATFADGSVVTVISRDTDVLRYSVISPTGQRNELKTFGGIVTLTAETPLQTNEFVWQQDLTGFLPLHTGSVIIATATIKSAGKADRAFTTYTQVLDVDSIRIGECVYPVLKILTRDQAAGGTRTHVTRYYSQEFMLSLRTLISIATPTADTAKIIENRVVKLE